MATETITTTLNRWRNDSVSLPDALKAWKDELIGAVGLVYSAARCRVLTLEELLVPNALLETMKIAPFEARVFNEDYELRWVAKAETFDGKKDDSEGACVVLSEKKLPENRQGCEPREAHYLKQVELAYYLWGETEKTENGCVPFFEHRMGKKLRIPTSVFGNGQAVSEKSRGKLLACEYIGVDDDHGNCTVVAERLYGWVSEAPKNVEK